MTAAELSRSSTPSRRSGWIIGLSLAGLGALTLGWSVMDAVKRRGAAGGRASAWLRRAQRRVDGWLPQRRGGRSLEDLARRVY